MKKITTALLIAVMAISAQAQEFKYSGQFRTRAVMYDLDMTKNADNSALNRKVDLRFRPQFEYKINDQFNSVMRLEIGDTPFGDAAKGGGQGTDGKIIEVKSLYLDYKPAEGHMIRTGLQNHMDPMVLVVEDDFAGIVYEGKFDKITAKAGWLVGADNGEESLNKETYSFGTTNFVFDVNFAQDKTMKFGLNSFTQMTSTKGVKISGADTLTYSKDKVGMWFAPYTQLSLMENKLNISGEFVYFMRSTEDNYVDKKPATIADYKDESGMAFMFKSGFAVTEQVKVGLNFLYTSGTDETDLTKDDAYSYYQGVRDNIGSDRISKFTEVGLEILGTNGAFDTEGLSPVLKGERYGVMLPVLYGNFAYDKNYSIGAAFGYGMTAAKYKYMENGATTATEESSLGMEFDINGAIKIGEKLALTPYAAFFMPSDGFQVAKSGSAGTETAPMKKEIGLKAEIKF